MIEDTLLQRITIDPNIMLGKPVIRGTRLTVEYILKLLASGASNADIRAEYAGLSDDDIRACLLFASNALDATTIFPLSAVES